MKTLLTLLQLFGSVGSTVPAALHYNHYQNSTQKATNRITTDWIKPIPTFPTEISYKFPKNATDIELAEFELTVEGSFYWFTDIKATIKKDTTWFSETEKKQVGTTLQKDKNIYFTTNASVLGQPGEWKLMIQFELPQFGWKLTATSDTKLSVSSKPEPRIRITDLKMKFSYSTLLEVTEVIHFNQQVIQTIRFGSQAGPEMPAQWNANFWLADQPTLLFRWMDYANSWEEFANAYPIIRLTSGNSSLRTYAVTQWDQDTSSGIFPAVNTRAITDQPDVHVLLSHSTAVAVHGEQHVSFGLTMYIYREDENIYATFEMVSESTFTVADSCQPGASASVFIGDIALG